jgi:hypothetical protein
MDYITHLPTCLDSGYNSVWVVVDRFSKKCHFIPCHHTITSKQTADLFIKEIFRLHGVPKTIVSDRDKNFTANFWETLVTRLGTMLLRSSGYHPQTDGQTERMNRTLEELLRAYCGAEHRQQLWDQYLPLVEFQYNNSVNASTGFTPFYLNYGQHPHTPATLLPGSDLPGMQVPADSDDFIRNLHEALSAAEASIHRAQERQKLYYDRGRTGHSFKVGDLVLVDKYGLPDERRGSKISPLRFGKDVHTPFKIIKQISPVAFQLDTPATWKVHNVFHTSFLTPYKPHREFEPETVLDSRTHKRKRQLLVRFKGMTADQDQWLDESLVKTKYPAVYLNFVRRFAAGLMHLSSVLP